LRYVHGLYVAFVVLFFIQLTSTTVFRDKYSGIAIFVSLGVFIIGAAFYVNAKRLRVEKEDKV